MSGGSDSGTQTQTTTSEPPAFVRPFSKELLTRARDISRNPFAPELPTGQSRVAGLDDAEIFAQQSVEDILGGGSPLSIADASIATLADPNAAFSPLTNSLVESAQKGLIDRFNLDVAPSTASAFQARGGLGNTSFAETDASQRFSLANALGEVDQRIRNDALTRAATAASLAPGLASARGEAATLLSAAGAQKRGISQAIRDIDFQNILAERNEPLSQLDVLARAIGTAQGGFGTNTTVSTGRESGNPLIAGIGAAGSTLGGAGALIAALSSKAFKEGKKKVDHKKTLARLESIPVERWNYKKGIADGGEHIGPYAEDFKEKFGVGSGKTINFVDAFGVGLSAIKGLAERVAELEAA